MVPNIIRIRIRDIPADKYKKIICSNKMKRLKILQTQSDFEIQYPDGINSNDVVLVKENDKLYMATNNADGTYTEYQGGTIDPSVIAEYGLITADDISAFITATDLQNEVSTFISDDINDPYLKTSDVDLSGYIDESYMSSHDEMMTQAIIADVSTMIDFDPDDPFLKQSDVDLTGYVTATDVQNEVSIYATESFVNNSVSTFITENNVSIYATESYVNNSVSTFITENNVSTFVENSSLDYWANHIVWCGSTGAYEAL